MPAPRVRGLRPPAAPPLPVTSHAPSQAGRKRKYLSVGRCVRHRRAVHHAHPRPSRPEPAPTGEAASDPGGLGRLVERRAISKELVAKLLAWRHPGFCAHVGETIAPEDKQRLEDTAAYLVRNPLSLKKLVYLDGQQAVLYRSKLNPFLGRNFEALDPLEWLARMSDHIPDPGQHRTLFYGEYANRVRGACRPSLTRPRFPQIRRPDAALQAGQG
jgi:hypothetical protein